MKPETRALLLIGLAAGAVAHIAWFGTWAVEDAAISWAYAIHLAEGLGAVPWDGAEPVEGYSNPTWTFLLALLNLVGVHPFWASKALAMGLTAATVFLVYRIGAHLVPEQPAAAGLTAAALFAVNTQVAIFGAAGLENPLFNFLLAAALLRLFREQAERLAPWSAALFGLLALTRPEGLAYGLVAGALSTAARIQERPARVEIARWWLSLLAPLLLWHLARWTYFAWELPATAYAKLPSGRAHMVDWNGPGWTYLRLFAVRTSQGWFLPLYVLGICGTRGRQARIGAVLVAAGALLYAAPLPDLVGLGPSRCLFPLAAGAVLWFGSHLGPGAHTRGVVWAMGMIAVFFTIYARGDWMEGTRWMAMAAVPGALILSAGIVELVELLRTEAARRFKPLGLVTGVLAFALSQGAHSIWFGQVLEISPWMVRARVWKGHQAADLLQIDERPRILTVDMGGFMMWSGWEINDIMGLVDMPMAQNRHTPWFRPFFAQYILEERRPHFIRLGTMLAQLKRLPGFEETYVRSLHAWRVRRDLMFEDRWTGAPDRRVAFGGSTLEGWQIPAAEVASGSSLSLEVGISNADQRDLKWWAFALDPNDQVAAVWDLPIHVPQTVDWAEGAVYSGRWTLALPSEMPAGDYRIGFAMRTLDALNGPDRNEPLPDGVEVAWDPSQARFRPGEVRFSEGFSVVDRATAENLAETDRQQALALARAGSCDASWQAWSVARKRGLGLGWTERHTPEHARAMASCLLSQATAQPDEAVDLLDRALTLDSGTPGLLEVAAAAADAAEARGDRAANQGKPLVALRLYSEVLRLDPYRTWVRRRAEEARASWFEAQIRGSASTGAD